MRRWGAQNPRAAYGGMFRRWLADETMGPYGSFGNGAAMRISPAGWAYPTLDETLKRARQYTEVTHNHPEGIKGAETVAGAIWLARQGSSRKELREWIGKH